MLHPVDMATARNREAAAVKRLFLFNSKNPVRDR
jgi:hypothetical protein